VAATQAEVLIPAMKDLNVLQKAIYENLQAAMLNEKTEQAATLPSSGISRVRVSQGKGQGQGSGVRKKVRGQVREGKGSGQSGWSGVSQGRVRGQGRTGLGRVAATSLVCESTYFQVPNLDPQSSTSTKLTKPPKVCVSSEQGGTSGFNQYSQYSHFVMK